MTIDKKMIGDILSGELVDSYLRKLISDNDKQTLPSYSKELDSMYIPSELDLANQQISSIPKEVISKLRQGEVPTRTIDDILGINVKTPSFKNSTRPDIDISSSTGILPQGKVTKAQAGDSSLASALGKLINNMPEKQAVQNIYSNTETPVLNATGGSKVGESSSFRGIANGSSPSGFRIDSSSEVNPYDIAVPDRGKIDNLRTFGANMLGVIGSGIAHGLNKDYKGTFEPKELIDYVQGIKDKEYEDKLKKLNVGVEKAKWDTARKDTKFDQAVKKRAQDIDEWYKKNAIAISNNKSSGIGSAAALKLQMAKQEEAQLTRDAITKYAQDNNVDLRDAIGIYTAVTKGVMPKDPANASLVKKHGAKLFNTVYNLRNTMRVKRPVAAQTNDSFWSSEPSDSALLYSDKASDYE